MNPYLELLKAAKEWGSRTLFITDAQAEVSFEALLERTQKLAGAMEKAGVSKGDVVAVLLPNCIELVELYLAQGKHMDAEPICQRSLAIREKALGPEHPDVAVSLSNLADLYRDQGKYGEAEPLYQRSLAIREKMLGPEHPDVATVLEKMAELYERMDRPVESAECLRRAETIRDAKLVR